MTLVSSPLPLALRASTLCEAFVRTAAERPGDVALRTPRDLRVVTWAEYTERVERIAAGLRALGVERGDTVALMLLNRPEFHLVDTAALHAGAIPFSIYNTSSLEQANEIFENARPVVAVTERALLPLVAAAARAQPTLRQVVLIDGREHNAMSLEELEERGSSGLDLRAAARATHPDDVATLVYTSGTSGAPKGVELTHANVLAAARAAQERLEVQPAGRVVSYLPAAHIVDRWQSHYHGSLGLGCTVTCVADPRQVLAVLPDARPTLWGGVPRVLEKLRAALIRRGIDDPGALTIEERIALRERLGLGDLRWLAGGAAPVPAPVLEYFGLLRLPVVEIWGMSETAGPGLANPPRAIRDGTCGLPVEGMELRLAPDSELLIRGPMIMRGYHRQPERTRRAFTTDGWMRTGDIASMDEDGYVAIIDRKKDIIISSAGKNMAPARIERTLAGGDPRIAAVVVIGDRRPYNVALVVLEPKAEADDPEVREAVSRAIAEGNRRLARAEQVKRWTILPGPWPAGGDEITATGKPRRAVIAAKYAEEIDALYEGPGESRLAEL
jgi:long-subunit acyl-CoA synthetase (AMP-forming)